MHPGGASYASLTTWQSRLRPFALCSIEGQLRDAPSNWRCSSFAFPGVRRFRILSCHSRPDRRGHIRSITPRPWLLRSSPCCSCSPALRFGAATTGVVQVGSFSMFCIRYGMDLGPLCYTGSRIGQHEVTLEHLNQTACLLAQALISLVWLVL